MTGPMPAGEAQAGTAMAQAQTQALIENAQRLGLIWVRRPATISSADLGAVTAIFDGDTEPIAMTSMIGPVGVDQRVYVDIVPPAGNFIVGIVVTSWIAPTLLNSWTNFGSGFQSARFRRLISGQVEIQGLVTGGTGPASTVFTLPAGYRPTAALVFSTIANNAIARLDVEADGDVRWQAGGTNAFLSLNCVFTP